jgi:F-type H+-transporting ATPase subunit b
MFNSDFFYRVFNFTIFAGLLYYLAANPIKAFFKGRTEGISNQLVEIEEKLQASKNDRIVAEDNLVKAGKRAKEIVNDASKEAKVLSANIVEKNDKALVLLEKQAEEKQALEVKKATRETIDDILNNGFEVSDVNIDEAKVVSLISKKVA